jgi:hypothetical protein
MFFYRGGGRATAFIIHLLTEGDGDEHGIHLLKHSRSQLLNSRYGYGGIAGNVKRHGQINYSPTWASTARPKGPLIPLGVVAAILCPLGM